MKVLVYSANHLIGVALKDICASNGKEKWDVSLVYDIDEIAFVAKNENPDYIVIDSAPRLLGHVIYTIRKQFPSVPFVFTQECFLYSDYIAVEFWGGMVLSKYDSLLEMKQEFTPYALITNKMFSGPFFSGGAINNSLKLSESEEGHKGIRNHMNEWLMLRVKWVIKSSCCRNFLRHLLDNDEITSLKARDDVHLKRQYYYRSIIKRVTGIKSLSRDFIASFKF